MASTRSGRAVIVALGTALEVAIVIFGCLWWALAIRAAAEEKDGQ